MLNMVHCCTKSSARAKKQAASADETMRNFSETSYLVPQGHAFFRPLPRGGFSLLAVGVRLPFARPISLSLLDLTVHLHGSSPISYRVNVGKSALSKRGRAGGSGPSSGGREGVGD